MGEVVHRPSVINNVGIEDGPNQYSRRDDYIKTSSDVIWTNHFTSFPHGKYLTVPTKRSSTLPTYLLPYLSMCHDKVCDR